MSVTAPIAESARNEILRRDGRLAGLAASEIGDMAARFGTPFYLYDLDVVERQVAALRAILPPNFELAYAVKANPALGIVAYLGRLGLGADVASGGEVETVRCAGIAPERVVFTGPGKRDDELERAVAMRIGVVTVESHGELRRLEAICARAARVQPVLLRAAVADGCSRGAEPVRILGDAGTGKFGMGAADLEAAAALAANSAHLEPLGVHAFGASNLLDAAALADHAAATMAAARDLAHGAGFPLRLVDIGGGLGIPYGDDEEALDLYELGRQLGRLASTWARDPLTATTRVLLEPGRFFVGPAGAYVARVLDRKRVGARDVIVLDGGIHHLLRPALVGQEHRVRAVADDDGGRNRSRSEERFGVVGPLCSGLDVLAAEARLADPHPGDLVAILDAGAYGFTESMPFFLSHATPAEVAVRGGRAQLLRPRAEPESWLEGQLEPAW